MRKKDNSERPDMLPGTTQVHIQLPTHLHEAMKARRTARHRTEGADTKLSALYREAVEQYLRGTDPETGAAKPRPRPPRGQRRSPVLGGDDGKGRLFERSVLQRLGSYDHDVVIFADCKSTLAPT